MSGWPEWIDAPARIGDLLAEHVLGARPGEVIVADSTTVNLFKLCSAVLDTREGAIVTDRGNFPTDRYVLEGLAARHGRELRLVATPEDAVAERGTALVVLSHVDYRSGELADLAALTAATDADVVWDLSHSAGALPVELRAAGVQLAVGCTYKYLNAGPGAPAFLYVAEERQAQLRSPIWGWFGQRDQFAMERDYDPVDGIGRFQAGTPPILALAAVEEGVKLTAEAGIGALRAKSIALDRPHRRAPRRLARAARLLARLAPRRRAARLARLAAPPRGVADQRRADRARRRRARLPRARLDPPRRRAALHGPRRRLGRARPPARAGGARGAPPRRHGAREGHVATASGARPRAAPARVGPGISVAAATTSRKASAAQRDRGRALAQRVAEHHDPGRDRGRVARDRRDRDHRDALADLQRARRGEERADARGERDEDERDAVDQVVAHARRRLDRDVADGEEQPGGDAEQDALARVVALVAVREDQQRPDRRRARSPTPASRRASSRRTCRPSRRPR